jgi:hypothetical protein
MVGASLRPGALPGMPPAPAFIVLGPPESPDPGRPPPFPLMPSGEAS